MYLEYIKISREVDRRIVCLAYTSSIKLTPDFSIQTLSQQQSHPNKKVIPHNTITRIPQKILCAFLCGALIYLHVGAGVVTPSVRRAPAPSENKSVTYKILLIVKIIWNLLCWRYVEYDDVPEESGTYYIFNFLFRIGSVMFPVVSNNSTLHKILYKMVLSILVDYFHLPAYCI